MQSGEVVTVLVGSALDNKGGRRLLNTIDKLFPSPLDRPAWIGEDGTERASSPDEPAACVVFKTLNDAFSGQVSMIRVLSGTISSETALRNKRSGETERLGSLLHVCG